MRGVCFARLLEVARVHVNADAAVKIWLARRWTRPRVRDGTPPLTADVPRARTARIASGTIIAGFFIVACMIALLQGLLV
jgi:hypothetical protein